MTIDDIPMEFTESPDALAAEEAAVRDEEASKIRQFGMAGSGFMSV